MEGRAEPGNPRGQVSDSAHDAPGGSEGVRGLRPKRHPRAARVQRVPDRARYVARYSTVEEGGRETEGHEQGVPDELLQRATNGAADCQARQGEPEIGVLELRAREAAEAHAPSDLRKKRFGREVDERIDPGVVLRQAAAHAEQHPDTGRPLEPVGISADDELRHVRGDWIAERQEALVAGHQGSAGDEAFGHGRDREDRVSVRHQPIVVDDTEPGTVGEALWRREPIDQAARLLCRRVLAEERVELGLQRDRDGLFRHWSSYVIEFLAIEG